VRSSSVAPRSRVSRPGVFALLLAAALLRAGALSAEPLEVVLVSPPANVPVFGSVELRAEVRSDEPVRWVEFLVDGRAAGRVESSPYALDVDVGQDNVSRSFRAVAVDVTGARAEHEIATPAIPIDEVVDVSLLQLYASVTDGGGAPVPNLVLSDFDVSSGGGRRERIVTFAGGDLPVSAVLLLDTSESMVGDPLAAALAGAQSWVAQTVGEDETMVALFSDRLLRATDFLAPSSGLDDTLRGVEATGGSAIYDAVYFALNRLESRLGRRVIVLLSDGRDVSSTLDMDDVLWRARRSQAVVFWLRLGAEGEDGGYASSWRGMETNKAQLLLLEQTVRDSGGREIRVPDPGQIERAFRQVLDELRRQYVLGIHPSERRYDGSWRPLRLRVRGGRYDVRTRAGFID
jgi:Ca-activated chloride channel homolog